MLTNLKHFFIGGIVAGLVIVFFLFIDGYDSVLMSKIQTRFYPVMGPFKITKTSDVIGGTMFSGCAERLRPECTAWRKTVWYLGSRGRGVFLTDDPHGDPRGALLVLG